MLFKDHVYETIIITKVDCSGNKKKKGELEKEAWKLLTVDAEYQNAIHTQVRESTLFIPVQ